MDIAAVASPIGLWTTPSSAIWLSPSWFLKPDVTIFRQEGGAKKVKKIIMTSLVEMEGMSVEVTEASVICGISGAAPLKGERVKDFQRAEASHPGGIHQQICKTFP